MLSYSCHVRLQGKVQNVVPLSNVTAAEIFVLRAVHGDDAVVEIQPMGDAMTFDRTEDGREKSHLRTDAEERARLETMYPQIRLVDLFGFGQKLPDVIEGVIAAAPPPTRRRAVREDLVDDLTAA